MPVENITPAQVVSVESPSVSAPQEINIKTKPYPNDSVELSDKPKKKKSAGKKILIGIGTAVATIVTGAILFARHQSVKLEKLYKEKLVLSNLPEKIEFKEAATLEEGIKYAKEVLGIKEVDQNFTLESINWANRGLVDVSNAYKGKVFMPQKLHYSDKVLGENTLAGVVRRVESKFFGDMFINPRYFDSNVLNKEIKEIYGLSSKEIKKAAEKTKDTADKEIKKLIEVNINEKDKELLDKFIENPESITIMEKRQLWQNGVKGLNRSTELQDMCPLELIKKLDKNLVEAGKPAQNIESLKNLSLKELQEKAQKMLVDFYEVKGRPFRIVTEQINPFRTIHHELGHLQDYAINLKNMDLKQWKFSFKETWKEIKTAREKGEKYQVPLDTLTNRWGTRSIIKKEMKKNPKTAQKNYPDLYKFLKDEKIQQTAGEVSWYAQTGIGEFIAEVHAGLIEGKKFSEDVMNLYKKYNGPMPVI